MAVFSSVVSNYMAPHLIINLFHSAIDLHLASVTL